MTTISFKQFQTLLKEDSDWSKYDAIGQRTAPETSGEPPEDIMAVYRMIHQIHNMPFGTYNESNCTVYPGHIGGPDYYHLELDGQPWSYVFRRESKVAEKLNLKHMSVQEIIDFRDDPLRGHPLTDEEQLQISNELQSRMPADTVHPSLR